MRGSFRLLGDDMDDGIEFDSVQERYHFWRGARYAAEELAWPLAALAGWVAHLEGLRWWLSVPIAVAVFFAVARYYGRREEAAEDAYERATGTGKYRRG